MPTRHNSHHPSAEVPLAHVHERDLDFSTFANGFVADLQRYADAQKRYLVLHASDKASVLLAKLLRSIVAVVTLAFSLLFLNIALALYLGTVLGSTSLGFCCVAVFYLLLLVCFLVFWRNGGRDRFILDRINDFTDGTDVR